MMNAHNIRAPALSVPPLGSWASAEACPRGGSDGCSCLIVRLMRCFAFSWLYGCQVAVQFP